MENKMENECNWCDGEIIGEPIIWAGNEYCCDTCLDECRAAQ